ncbi:MULTISPECIES: succinylglutamate desuccinylase [unclassified Mesotoga]|uniref:succinylglutamate desuccinylase n=1 Tax=unclassified Mesotoga TaxID=1184398 RepID=UPI00217DBEF0|nr:MULTISPECIES: succinylglutamate desuccinylase [unclassified Mesotoga]MDD3681365.1 succinylglutamate desuccinylase [Mesotoga sp.]MDD5683408.1 succinylglutamate desuccinylase [Mesotoga sp.]
MRKLIIAVILVLVVLAGGIPLYIQRGFKEEVVAGPSVTNVFKLSKYFDGIEGTIADTDVFELKGAEEGGKTLIIAGTHANEPSAALLAYFFIENLEVEKGTVYIIPHFNLSGSLGPQPGGGFPLYYYLDTPWGEQAFRMGDRGFQALDQWPDPDVYVHYPDGQLLSYIDARNTNRAWPGRPDGYLAEKVCFAAMEMIRGEGIDIAIDLHEAEAMYPVTNCIVAPEKSMPYAIGAAFYVKGREKFENHVESSPSGYRGLSHREIGDWSDAYPFLLESPGVHLDQITAAKTPELIIDGIDPFVLKAGEKGLLYVPYDENGFSMDRRVGQHSSVIQEILSQWTKKNPERGFEISAPKHADIVENGLGFYFKDPSEVDSKMVYLQ